MKTSAFDPFADLLLPIPAGVFDMGDVLKEGFLWESPVHRVSINAFLLCKYPVTQAQWLELMGNNPAHFHGDENLPIESVSWQEMQVFIQKLNERTGKNYRLPTESEWEYAAREGGQQVRFGNGKNIADTEEMNFNGTIEGAKDFKQAHANPGNWRYYTLPVHQFEPNAFGLYQMSGNVWEMCADLWHESYTGAPDDGSPWLTGGDPLRRVARGGSWNLKSEYCRNTARSRSLAAYANHLIGFRLAHDLD